MLLSLSKSLNNGVNKLSTCVILTAWSPDWGFSQRPLCISCSCPSIHEFCPFTQWTCDEGQKPLERGQRMPERRDGANLVPSSPPCMHVADGPYLVTVKHRRAAMPRGPWSARSARQTGGPLPTEPSSALIREDKLGPACDSFSIHTIHLKILNDHIVQMVRVRKQSLPAPLAAITVRPCSTGTSGSEFRRNFTK